MNAAITPTGLVTIPDTADNRLFVTATGVEFHITPGEAVKLAEMLLDHAHDVVKLQSARYPRRPF